jgi:tRNA-specific 2-thiouridylase
VVDDSGNVVGHHDGVEFYTIGQRHGLSIPNRLPYYVARKDIKKNIIFVSLGDENEKLFRSEAITGPVVWTDGEEKTNFSGQAVVRYHHKAVNVEAGKLRGKNGYLVNFLEPQRAVTVGQAIVFYQGDELVGGGFIEG